MANPAVAEAGYTHEAQEAAIEMICGNVDVDTWRSFRGGCAADGLPQNSESNNNSHSSTSSNVDGIEKMHLFGQQGPPCHINVQKKQPSEPIPSSSSPRNNKNDDTIAETNTTTIRVLLHDDQEGDKDDKHHHQIALATHVSAPYDASHHHQGVYIPTTGASQWGGLLNYIQEKNSHQNQLYYHHNTQNFPSFFAGAGGGMMRMLTEAQLTVHMPSIPLGAVDTTSSNFNHPRATSLIMHNNKDTTTLSKKRRKQQARMKSFEERVIELTRFKALHGHCNVPFKYPSLGVWCNQARASYAALKRGTYTSKMLKMNPERIKILEDLGFKWSATKTFDEHLADLIEFKKIHGHCIPTADYPMLRSWSYYMRRCYKDQLVNRDKDEAAEAGTISANGKIPKPKQSITAVQIKKLNEIGFQWTTRKTFDDRIEELVAFKEKHGHCNVPRKYPSLGIWCENVRQAYSRRHKGKPVLKFNLSEERVARLQEVGFRWRRGGKVPS